MPGIILVLLIIGYTGFVIYRKTKNYWFLSGKIQEVAYGIHKREKSRNLLFGA